MADWLANFKVPGIGWTFASDFLTSKVTHLAVVVIAGAWHQYLVHLLPQQHALAATLAALAVAFLRDAHVKGHEGIQQLLLELLEDPALLHADPTSEPHDGEADADAHAGA